MAALPSHPNLRHFAKGFTTLKQTTGTEMRQIQSVILGVLAGLVPDDVLNAMRATLDFIYYAQLRTHTTFTLDLLSDALNAWHGYKNVFVRLGIRTMPLFFRINKLHAMDHIPGMIMALGTPRGFNTELPERLHILNSKVPYKATNHKSNFLEQMCTYLTRSESLDLFDRFLQWAATPEGLAFDSTPGALYPINSYTTLGVPPVLHDVPSTFRGNVRAQWTLPRTSHRLTQLSLYHVYGTTNFLPELNNYLRIRQPQPNEYPTPLTTVSVYNQAAVRLSDPLEEGLEEIVRAYPVGTRGEGGEVSVEGHFDTVLVRDNWQDDDHPRLEGIHGFRVGQLRAIFTLPEAFGVREALAYLELFTIPQDDPIANVGLHRIRRLAHLGNRRAQVVPLEHIYRAVHLIPMFGGRTSGWNWTTANALEVCDTFYVNRYLDSHAFMLLY